MKAAFHHPRRACHWCAGHFQPLDTLSPHSSEHFCSAECALENHNAKALNMVNPGVYDTVKAAVVVARAQWSAEVAQRLKEGRQRAAERRNLDGESTVTHDEGGEA